VVNRISQVVFTVGQAKDGVLAGNEGIEHIQKELPHLVTVRDPIDLIN
jgi:hypothetical protein